MAKRTSTVKENGNDNIQRSKRGGRRLARELTEYQGQENVIVLGLPRGGVPVAYQVAKVLDVPLVVFLVRKLGLPQVNENWRWVPLLLVELK
jgi:putative phosphoribosyl transferase